MLLYNSKSRAKEEFIPLNDKEVRIYVCGPTVYDDAHLGHARSAVVFDLLKRVLLTQGFKVTFAKNFTDIDDKIINKMRESGESLEELTGRYIQRYKAQMRKLNILEDELEPKATENIPNIITFIEHLIEKGCAYAIDDGVYFEVAKDSKYFTLSHRKMEESEAQHRVESSKEKRGEGDFALWKFAKDDDLVSYESPWGRGRPGWHIECSAMIKAHLALSDKAYQIDIHGGGSDLLFPHHENEAAQSRCESGVELAKYWMHNGFVQIDGEKMSKSLGNSFFLKDALEHYSGEVIRYYLLSTHYRANFNFSTKDMLSAKKRLDKLYRLKKRIMPSKASSPNRAFQKALLEALSDDLNTSKALSLIDDLVSSANELLDKNPKDKALKREIAANIEFIDEIMGFGGSDAYEYFQFGIDKEKIKEIEELIAKRDEAKREKDYQNADAIRERLKEMGVALMDTPEGTKWEMISSEEL